MSAENGSPRDAVAPGQVLGSAPDAAPGRRPGRRSPGFGPWTLLVLLVATGTDGHDVEQLEALFAIATDSEFIVDASGRIVRSNPEADRLFGGAGRDLRGVSFLEVATPASRAEVQRSFAQSRDGSRSIGPVAFRAVRGDGTPFPAELSVVGVPDPPPGGFAVVVREASRGVAGPETAPPPAEPPFDFAEALFARRLRELV